MTRRGKVVTHILIKPHLVEIHRIAPRRLVPDITSFDIKTMWPHPFIALRAVTLEIRGNNIERTLVEPDRRGPDAASGFGGAYLNLAGTVQAMANESPLDEVSAMVNGGSGEVFKSGRDEEVVVRTRTMEGSGLKPGRMGLIYSLIMGDIGRWSRS